MTKPASCIFAVHFDDDQDPRYKEIIKLMMSMDMWRDRNLVYAAVFDSRDELSDELDKLSEVQDD